MRMYLALIVLLFLVVLIGAGWLLRRSEEEYRAEMKQLQEENEYLRDKVNRLTAHEMLKI
jgi:cell division protein FtsB